MVLNLKKMSKIPTAKEFLHQSKSLHNMWDNTRGRGEWDEEAIANSHIEFAKLHVEAALKEASKKAKCCDDAIVDLGHTIIEAYVEENSILNAYPLENIK